MLTWKRGDLVELDAMLAVVVAIFGDPDVPEDHVTLWFGQPISLRKSQGGISGQRPEVWTVPVALLVAAAEPFYKH